MWICNVPLTFSKSLQQKEFCNGKEDVDGPVIVYLSYYCISDLLALLANLLAIY